MPRPTLVINEHDIFFWYADTPCSLQCGRESHGIREDALGARNMELVGQFYSGSPMCSLLRAEVS